MAVTPYHSDEGRITVGLGRGRGARVTPRHESRAAENLRLVDSPRNGSFLRSAYGQGRVGCGTNLMPRHALVV